VPTAARLAAFALASRIAPQIFFVAQRPLSFPTVFIADLPLAKSPTRTCWGAILTVHSRGETVGACGVAGPTRVAREPASPVRW